MGTSVVFVFVVFVGSATVDLESCLSSWRERISGPTATASQLPWPQKLMRPGGWNVYLLPASIRFSAAADSVAVVGELGLQAPPLLFPCFYLLSVF